MNPGQIIEADEHSYRLLRALNQKKTVWEVRIEGSAHVLCREHKAALKICDYDLNNPSIKGKPEEHVATARKIAKKEAELLATFETDLIPDIFHYFTTASLDPGIIALNLQADEPMIVMELIDSPDPNAKSLWDWTRKSEANVLSERQLILVGASLCCALNEFHGKGWIYQDLRPDNIVRAGENLIRLVDLDSMCPINDSGGIGKKGSGYLVGRMSPGYLAPEAERARQEPKYYRGRRIDHRFDLYSLGATLLALAARKSPEALAWDAGRESIPDILAEEARQCKVFTNRTKDVILRLLAPNPDDRFPTALDALIEIERYLQAPPPLRSFQVNRAGADVTLSWAAGRKAPREKVRIQREARGKKAEAWCHEAPVADGTATDRLPSGGIFRYSARTIRPLGEYPKGRPILALSDAKCQEVVHLPDVSDFKAQLSGRKDHIVLSWKIDWLPEGAEVFLDRSDKPYKLPMTVVPSSRKIGGMSWPARISRGVNYFNDVDPEEAVNRYYVAYVQLGITLSSGVCIDPPVVFPSLPKSVEDLKVAIVESTRRATLSWTMRPPGIHEKGRRILIYREKRPLEDPLDPNAVGFVDVKPRMALEDENQTSWEEDIDNGIPYWYVVFVENERGRSKGRVVKGMLKLPLSKFSVEWKEETNAVHAAWECDTAVEKILFRFVPEEDNAIRWSVPDAPASFDFPAKDLSGHIRRFHDYVVQAWACYRSDELSALVSGSVFTGRKYDVKIEVTPLSGISWLSRFLTGLLKKKDAEFGSIMKGRVIMVSVSLPALPEGRWPSVEIVRTDKGKPGEPVVVRTLEEGHSESFFDDKFEPGVLPRVEDPRRFSEDFKYFARLKEPVPLGSAVHPRQVRNVCKYIGPA